MEPRTGKSIWDDMPEGWGTDAKEQQKPDSERQEEPQEREAEREEIPISPETANEDNKEKQKQKKTEKEKYVEFEKKRKESRLNSSEHVKKAYQKEEKGNKHDFLILGVVVAIAVVGIVIFIFAFTRTSTQRIYDLIDQGNYSIAYQSIDELYEKDKNVDSLTYAFAKACVNDSEYKRAVASLEFLSDEAETNTEFFEEIIDSLLAHGKLNRAVEVLQYMQSHGEKLSQYAEQLYQKNMENFQGGD